MLTFDGELPKLLKFLTVLMVYVPLRDFDCTLKNCSLEKVIILVQKWVGSTSKKQMRMCGLTSSKVHT